tara:strand:+ start:134 stop:751 length:618 start_codon:yes stop_codon:yes gene_type:complete
MTDLTRNWTLGYDLDTGGYEFEEPAEDSFWHGKPVLLWEGPDADYIDSDWDVDGDADLMVVAPNSGHFQRYDFPESYTDGVQIFRKVGGGDLRPSDHECNCTGRLVAWCGAAGEPQVPENPVDVLKWLQEAGEDAEKLIADDLCDSILLDLDGEIRAFAAPVFWEGSGNSKDKPYPRCDRCDGEGHVDSPGGEYAIYEWVWEDED